MTTQLLNFLYKHRSDRTCVYSCSAHTSWLVQAYECSYTITKVLLIVSKGILALPFPLMSHLPLENQSKLPQMLQESQ